MIDCAHADVMGYRVPTALDRAARVKLLTEAADALLAGRQPSREAALSIGGALNSWLQSGDSLEEHNLRVSAQRGSHATPAGGSTAHS